MYEVTITRGIEETKVVIVPASSYGEAMEEGRKFAQTSEGWERTSEGQGSPVMVRKFVPEETAQMPLFGA